MLKPALVTVSLLGLVFAQPAVAADLAQSQAAVPPAGGIAVERLPSEVPIFIVEQSSDHVLAGSIIGADVVDAAGNQVGTVEDLILDTRGNALGVIVNAGGILGFGGKSIGISFGPAQLEDGEEPEEKRVRLSVTKSAIEAGPAFVDAADRRAEAEKQSRASRPRRSGGPR